MIKTFEQFNNDEINQYPLNESAESVYATFTYISPDSRHYIEAENLFKKETGKDLKRFSWVYQQENPSLAICPPKFIVALMSVSPTFKNYLPVVNYINEILQQDDIGYDTGVFNWSIDSDKISTIAWNRNQMDNAKIVYNIWVNYFYIPIKNAILTKQYSSINYENMANFVRVMNWGFWNSKSDWVQFFASIRAQIELAAKNEELLTSQQQQQIQQQIQKDQKAVKDVNTTPKAKGSPSQQSNPSSKPNKFSGTFK